MENNETTWKHMFFGTFPLIFPYFSHLPCLAKLLYGRCWEIWLLDLPQPRWGVECHQPDALRCWGFRFHPDCRRKKRENPWKWLVLQGKNTGSSEAMGFSRSIPGGVVRWSFPSFPSINSVSLEFTGFIDRTRDPMRLSPDQQPACRNGLSVYPHWEMVGCNLCWKWTEAQQSFQKPRRPGGLVLVAIQAKSKYKNQIEHVTLVKQKPVASRMAENSRLPLEIQLRGHSCQMGVSINGGTPK